MSNSLSDQNSRSSLLSFYKSSSRLNSIDNDFNQWNIQPRLIRTKKSKDNNSIQKSESGNKNIKNLFRKTATTALILIRTMYEHDLRVNIEDDLTPYISDLHFYGTKDLQFEKGIPKRIKMVRRHGEMDFDPRDYKANRQLRISEQLRRSLTKPANERNQEEIRQITVALRNIETFGEYPIRMQEKIAAVGNYERYEGKRVILRQGHPAHAFYFILSGCVVVMVTDKESSFTKPVAYLPRGKSFGELAIINRTSRQSSVIAKEPVELLSISVEDFNRIFMDGGSKNTNDPDHYRFLKEIYFLKGFDLMIFKNNPSKCLFHYFKRGEVLVKDSNYFDWLIIVKSGSLQVIKKLRRPFRFLDKRHQQLLQDFERKRQKEKEEELLNQQRQQTLPDLRISLLSPECVNSEKNVSLSLPNITSTDFKDQSLKSFLGRFSSREKKRLIENSDNKPYLSRSLASFTTSPKTIIGSSFNFPEDKVKDYNVKKKDKEEIDDDLSKVKQEVRTIATDLDSAYKNKKKDACEADIDPIYVEIQTLTKGQVFGLQHCFLDNQPSLSVVSNGTECILIDKKLYKMQLTTSGIEELKLEMASYPSDEFFQRLIDDRAEWQAYRLKALKNTLKCLSLN
ncbi:DgyrCDS11350 [Dimorphilus gyrociliatus]|uniref:DgyrCDS11350 n=1 Tax=Dimorphilus gyrociliatus TaxID=2664684 RepID=A0A7I8W314_9ANNE|nr:DgyrCDS11350 [Dimorphilus gyrociliatus]